MYKFVVVTDPESAPGFRLAGVEVISAISPEEAKKVISSLLKSEDTGIVAVNEDFMPSPEDPFMDRIDKSFRPVIIGIPFRSRTGTRLSSLERLLRKAIGYNVVVRR